MCGASDGLKDAGKSDATFASTLTNQSGQVFGDSTQIFSDLTSAFEPIAAAGVGQEGFTPAEKAAMTSSVIENNGIAARNARAATGDAINAVGGGNTVLPSGTAGSILAKTNEDFAQSTAAGLNDITQKDYAVGRENFFAATKALSGATDVFNPATSSANAATGAESVNLQAQNDIQQANDSWMTPVAGILGGIAGGITTGGMSNLGKGKGFFGG